MRRGTRPGTSKTYARAPDNGGRVRRSLLGRHPLVPSPSGGSSRSRSCPFPPRGKVRMGARGRGVTSTRVGPHLTKKRCPLGPRLRRDIRRAGLRLLAPYQTRWATVPPATRLRHSHCESQRRTGNCGCQA